MKTDLNYSGNVMIGPRAEVLRQNLYSSQTYQTFYSIFGKFQYDNIDENQAQLSGLELELINYKGVLDIQFFKKDQVKGQDQGPYDKGYTLEEVTYPAGFKSKTNHDTFLHLRLFVCARGTNDVANDTLAVDPNDLKANMFKNGQLLYIERETISMNGQSSEMIKNSSETEIKTYKTNRSSGIFDDEFFYRNGRLWAKRHDTDKSLLDKNRGTNSLFNASLFNGNPSCHHSAINIHITK